MPRNSDGSYSLPSGNPVVTHTTITSTWANTTLSDIATTLSTSLDVYGRNSMQQPLPLANGSSALPSLTFASETTSGLFRNASNDFEFAVNGTVVLKWLAAGIAAPLGATLTQSQANAAALVATGNGTAAAITSTGGSSNGAGLSGTGGGTSGTGVAGAGGSSNGTGVAGTGGSSSGDGGHFTAGGTGRGVLVTATTGDGVVTTGSHGVVATGTAFEGVFATGAAGQAGVKAKNGTAATSSARQDALVVDNGDVSLGAANPNSNVGFSNRLTPKNVVKAWGRATTNGSGAVALDDGFNISGLGIVGASLTVTLVTAMADTNYAVVASMYDPSNGLTVPLLVSAVEQPTRTQSAFILAAMTTTGFVTLTTRSVVFSFQVLGAQ